MRGENAEQGEERVKETEGGAGGVIFNRDGKVLVLRRANGPWVFPKGHIDPGETALQAALREVEEESGVKATCPDPQRTYSTSYVNAYGVPREITWFVLHTDDSEFRMSEALFPEGEFVTPQEALERLEFEPDRELFRAVMRDQERLGSPDAPDSGEAE